MGTWIALLRAATECVADAGRRAVKQKAEKSKTPDHVQVLVLRPQPTAIA